MIVSAETKKPKWTIVTFKQIETARASLGLSKAAMAQALGVTNSTFHNWQRDATVPHPAQQESIKASLASLAAGGKGSVKPTRKAGKSSERGGSSRENVHGGSMPAHGFSEAHPFFPARPFSVQENVGGIATITAAYINAQKSAPSPDEVYSFISGLSKTLSKADAPVVETPPPEAVVTAPEAPVAAAAV
jgi:DNA-binding XRE family transcriptional regulator